MSAVTAQNNMSRSKCQLWSSDVHLSTILCFHFHSWRGWGRLCISALTLLRQRRISAPDSVSSPAQPSPYSAQPSPCWALPCHYFYFLCGGNWPRRVSCRDHWSCAEQCKFPHSICKIHCTFAKTFQVLSAYQYQKLHCLKNIFIFVFRYFCRQETLRHVNCSGNNIT